MPAADAGERVTAGDEPPAKAEASAPSPASHETARKVVIAPASTDASSARPAAAAVTPAPVAQPATPSPAAASPVVPAAAVQPVASPDEDGDNPPTQPIATAQAPFAAYLQRDEHQMLSAKDVKSGVERLRGPAAKVVTNMEASLQVPTATSVRSVPAKAIMDNRIVINNHLSRTRGGKVSFTHLIGFAIVEALAELPAMNAAYAIEDGKPAVVTPEHVNFGLAIDLAKPDGSRRLLVPNVKDADSMDFAQFWSAYEDVVKRARAGALQAADFQGTTITLTNPGTIGTVHSVPRLMQGQGTIIGVGAMDYPAEFQGASIDTVTRLGVSKVMTLTSTYDHRVIQGAQSGEFLAAVHKKAAGSRRLL
ncbi:hypothetical protein GCM10025876_27680 [Demequina litorisediminis]|uniref:2-oxoacid dehydrogenase acyltransferase catalytic domain-containing protein n=1 Tax=Demequina litorisediminis TaxID=1849022 RepID=A0ABQ6IFA0_9MICO|nr:hypothetical protein GCM10025876_27680 [Demequina litorisediminis]